MLRNLMANRVHSVKAPLRSAGHHPSSYLSRNRISSTLHPAVIHARPFLVLSFLSFLPQCSRTTACDVRLGDCAQSLCCGGTMPIFPLPRPMNSLGASLVSEPGQASAQFSRDPQAQASCSRRLHSPVRVPSIHQLIMNHGANQVDAIPMDPVIPLRSFYSGIRGGLKDKRTHALGAATLFLRPPWRLPRPLFTCTPHSPRHRWMQSAIGFCCSGRTLATRVFLN